ncbi:hypothetical protein [Variovorax boronicumulans]
MTPARKVMSTEGQGASLELDEAFLRRVDRAGLACKQGDPYRLEQVHRALEEEAYLASVNGSMYLDRPPRRDPS